MTTQLELPFAPALDTRRLPNVDNITIPFEWERVDYLLSIPSVDFGTAGLTERNRQYKRSDWRYNDLVEDLQDQGYLDPIFVWAPGTNWRSSGEVLGNGHHRLTAAKDLGYTHVPVTRDPDEQWRRSGLIAQ